MLVGTYRKGQLAGWRGWYNYPLSVGDEVAEKGAAEIGELWLFNGTKGERRYRAEFVGVKTREELVRDYDYPAGGKAHAEKYLLFKTQRLYAHKHKGEGGAPAFTSLAESTDLFDDDESDGEAKKCAKRRPAQKI